MSNIRMSLKDAMAADDNHELTKRVLTEKGWYIPSTKKEKPSTVVSIKPDKSKDTLAKSRI